VGQGAETPYWIVIKFFVVVEVPDFIIHAKFQGFGDSGVKIPSLLLIGEHELELYVVVRPSVVCLSVFLSVVCNVRAPYSGY